MHSQATWIPAVEKAFSITVRENLEVALEQAWGNCQLLELGKLDKECMYVTCEATSEAQILNVHPPTVTLTPWPQIISTYCLLQPLGH